MTILAMVYHDAIIFSHLILWNLFYAMEISTVWIALILVQSSDFSLICVFTTISSIALILNNKYDIYFL